MDTIKTVDELEALYDQASTSSLTKVATQLTPHYQTWIEASRFVVLSSVGPEGTDASPRGDNGSVVRIADTKTLWLPDWRGNNRMDSLRNIVRDGRVSLMFMIPGCNTIVRVNGSATLTADKNATNQFTINNKQPKTVIVITIAEVYFQCAKALMRSGLWESQHQGGHVPSAGDFLKEAQADFDSESYDANYDEYARGKMW